MVVQIRESGGLSTHRVQQLPNRANTRYLNKVTYRPIQSWNRFKWLLFIANSLQCFIGLAGLLFSIVTWANGYLRAEVVVTSNKGILVITSVAGAGMILNAALGFYGIFTNNRRVLSVWAMAQWLLMGLVAAIGYIAYKRSLWNLRAKLGSQWRRFGFQERYIIQNNLHCCGFQGPLDHPSLSKNCFTRSLLPGCLGKYYRFNAYLLQITCICAFSTLLPCLFLIVVSILCSNHVNNKWNRDHPPRLNY
ncbi:hypothetical protein K493DRAFT_390891, partial [Basidiobolus meristosporus CBS 931.73]